MFKLAEQYASLLGTHILDHKIYDDEIVFILASGKKLRFNESQLKKEISALEPEEPKAKPVKAKAVKE